MKYLADANIWLRFSAVADPLHTIIKTAFETLRLRGDEIVIVPQCLYEFWVVATRPLSARGGFGMSLAEADNELTHITNLYPLLSDTANLFAEWRRLLVLHGVSGVAAHDTRLVAAMREHGITQLLTLNTSDFARYTEITAVHPNDV